jgi:energy-converting hydrogenase A subunit R
MAGQIVFDCEGPITLNDNALELCQFLVPDGGRFFSQISQYDDYLADTAKRSGYKAGNTLKLILPFLKVFGGTDRAVQDYSRNNLLLLPEAVKMVTYLASRTPVFIISTSYEPYIRALCEQIGFSFEQAYCTHVDFDKYPISSEDEKLLRSWTEEILAMPVIDLPASASRFEELDSSTRESIVRLDEIFWREIPRTKIQAILDGVDPVGGEEKAKALRDSLERTGFALSQVMYVGDSITDVQVFDLVRQGGGLTVSFNGNRYALQAAEVACVCGTNLILSALADIFLKHGRERVIELISDWSMLNLSHADLEPDLLGELGRKYLERLPTVELVTDADRERLIKESEDFRAKIRGLAGKLG